MAAAQCRVPLSGTTAFRRVIIAINTHTFNVFNIYICRMFSRGYWLRFITISNRYNFKFDRHIIAVIILVLVKYTFCNINCLY